MWATLSRRLVARLRELNRWARYRTVGTKDTTITGPRSQPRLAGLTLIVEQTRIGRHGFRLLATTYGTDDSGFSLNGGHYIYCYFSSAGLPRRRIDA